jgi:hypothetical protein
MLVADRNSSTSPEKVDARQNAAAKAAAASTGAGPWLISARLLEGV